MVERSFRIDVAYDGTPFSGFQRQAQGERTVQGELERAVETLVKDRVAVVGAGRTDAGVHARAQVCHFRTATSIPPERMPLALNSVLPPEIVVWRAQEVAEAFHAQHSALRKRYCYRIWTERYPSPFWRRYTYHVWRELNIENMVAAARLLVGRHDFASFRAAGSDTEGTVRTLSRLELRKRGPLLELWFEADGFLYKMVRIMVGTLLEVGLGRESVEWVAGVLAARNRNAAGATAPPWGLCLERVYYPGDPDPEADHLPEGPEGYQFCV